jgi:hypothetical protein
VDIDFKEFATHRDLDQTKGHAPEKKIGPLRFKGLRRFKNKTFADGKNWKRIPGEDGATVEDGFGVLLIKHITQVFNPEEIHMCAFILSFSQHTDVKQTAKC